MPSISCDKCKCKYNVLSFYGNVCSVPNEYAYVKIDKSGKCITVKIEKAKAQQSAQREGK